MTKRDLEWKKQLFWFTITEKLHHGQEGMAAGNESRKLRGCNFTTHRKKTGNNKKDMATKPQSPTKVSTSSSKAVHPKCSKASSNSVTTGHPMFKYTSPLAAFSFSFFFQTMTMVFVFY